MRVNRVPDPGRRERDRPLERRIAERLHLPAVVTDDVMVVLAGPGRLEAGDAVAHVDALHQPELRERVEDTVDAGDPDRPALAAEELVQLLRADTAALAREELEDGRPGAPGAKAGALDGSVRRREPAHPQTIAVLNNVLDWPT